MKSIFNEKLMNESDEVIKKALKLDEPANIADEDEETIERNIKVIKKAITIQKKLVDKNKEDDAIFAVYQDLKDKLEKWEAEPEEEEPEEEFDDEEVPVDDEEIKKILEKSKSEIRKEKKEEKRFKKKKARRKRKADELNNILEEKEDLPKSEIFKLFNEEKEILDVDLKETEITEIKEETPSKLSIFLNS